MSVEELMEQAEALSPADQSRFAAELARKVLQKRLAEIVSQPDAPLPLTDGEIDQLVHEARRETLRASGL